MEKYGLLFESIFKRKLTDENTVSYLENLAKEHPYFSVAQFYLLQLSQKDTNGYKAQAKKTAALFNNNHWLNFQLLEAGCADEPETLAAMPGINENFTGNIPAVNTSTANNTTEQTEASFNETVNTAEPIIEEPAVEDAVDEIDIEDKPAAIEQVETVKSVADGTTDQVGTITEKETPAEKEPEAALTVEENTSVTETAAPVEEPIATIQNEPPATEEIKEAVDEKPVETVVEATPKNEPLLFEPLHTTDYFASVGIKLSEEERSSDRLGKQLKSFTDWLKTMKKVHTKELAQTTHASEVEGTGTESSIQKMAEKSNQENDVITEAMAEVLLQQGRQDKAIEILEKLSLLNPSKSAYFATKINQIKDK